MPDIASIIRKLAFAALLLYMLRYNLLENSFHDDYDACESWLYGVGVPTMYGLMPPQEPPQLWPYILSNLDTIFVCLLGVFMMSQVLEMVYVAANEWLWPPFVERAVTAPLINIDDEDEPEPPLAFRFPALINNWHQSHIDLIDFDTEIELPASCNVPVPINERPMSDDSSKTDLTKAKKVPKTGAIGNPATTGPYEGLLPDLSLQHIYVPKRAKAKMPKDDVQNSKENAPPSNVDTSNSSDDAWPEEAFAFDESFLTSFEDAASNIDDDEPAPNIELALTCNENASNYKVNYSPDEDGSASEEYYVNFNDESSFADDESETGSRNNHSVQDEAIVEEPEDDIVTVVNIALQKLLADVDFLDDENLQIVDVTSQVSSSDDDKLPNVNIVSEVSSAADENTVYEEKPLVGISSQEELSDGNSEIEAIDDITPVVSSSTDEEQQPMVGISSQEELSDEDSEIEANDDITPIVSSCADEEQPMVGISSQEELSDEDSEIEANDDITPIVSSSADDEMVYKEQLLAGISSQEELAAEDNTNVPIDEIHLDAASSADEQQTIVGISSQEELAAEVNAKVPIDEMHLDAASSTDEEQTIVGISSQEELAAENNANVPNDGIHLDASSSADEEQSMEGISSQEELSDGNSEIEAIDDITPVVSSSADEEQPMVGISSQEELSDGSSELEAIDDITPIVSSSADEDQPLVGISSLEKLAEEKPLKEERIEELLKEEDTKRRSAVPIETRRKILFDFLSPIPPTDTAWKAKMVGAGHKIKRQFSTMDLKAMYDKDPIVDAPAAAAGPSGPFVDAAAAGPSGPFVDAAAAGPSAPFVDAAAAGPSHPFVDAAAAGPSHPFVDAAAAGPSGIKMPSSQVCEPDLLKLFLRAGIDAPNESVIEVISEIRGAIDSVPPGYSLVLRIDTQLGGGPSYIRVNNKGVNSGSSLPLRTACITMRGDFRKGGLLEALRAITEGKPDDTGDESDASSVYHKPVKPKLKQPFTFHACLLTDTENEAEEDEHDGRHSMTEIPSTAHYQKGNKEKLPAVTVEIVKDEDDDDNSSVMSSTIGSSFEAGENYDVIWHIRDDTQAEDIARALMIFCPQAEVTYSPSTDFAGWGKKF